jgi:cyclase
MDVKRVDGQFHVFTKGGREDAGIDALRWAEFGEESGAGRMEHFLTLFREIPGVGAGLAASIFHLKEINILDLKKYLSEHGVDVRI